MTRTLHAPIDIFASGRTPALTTDSADFVIVGTGPGGATAGRVLAEAGFDVLFVEEGRHIRDEDVRADAWSAFRNAWRDASMQVAQGRALWPILQGCAVGGTTPVNGAIIHRIPEAVFDDWAREGRVGDRITLARLHETFDQLDRELHVAPVPDAVRGNNNRMFAAAADALGWKNNVIRRNVTDCQGSGRCTQVCPSQAKQSLDRNFLPFAQERGARIYQRARVERVMMNGTRATGVEGHFRDPATRERRSAFRFEARRAVIMAAGAVHTPSLLAQSGLAGRRSLVGRRFMGHPGTSVLIRFPHHVGMFEGATQGHESTQYWHEDMKFETVGIPPGVAAARLPGFGTDLYRRLDELPYMAHWGLQIRARAEGRVRPGLFGGRPRISYSFLDRDVATMKLAMERLITMAFSQGAEAVMPGVFGLPEEITSMDQLALLRALPDDPRLFHGICAHLFGTASMGADAASGAIDETGALFGATGLYVVDASVLPTNMGVNPQHTICAFAWLIAQGLAESA